ncbi:hypothetical protein FQN57_003643 [Myotisia sp. PD_48]|nr:hypothetical protein FQN57_003643 [Myotisia sp. PD_48]
MKFNILIFAGLVSLAAALPEREPRAACDCSAKVSDNLTFTVKIKSFQDSRKAKRPACCDWSSDNCSWSPDKPSGFDFIPSCQRHDFGYRNGKKQKRFNETYRKKVDDNFKKDLYAYCSKFSGLQSYKGVQCRRYADVYHAAVRRCGDGDCKDKREVLDAIAAVENEEEQELEISAEAEV